MDLRNCRSVVFKHSRYGSLALKVSFPPWRNWCYIRATSIYCFSVWGEIKGMTAALPERGRTLFDLGRGRNESSVRDVQRDDHLGEAWGEPLVDAEWERDNVLCHWQWVDVVLLLQSFLGQHQRRVSSQAQWRKPREAEWMRVISHMSVLAPRLPLVKFSPLCFHAWFMWCGWCSSIFSFSFNRWETGGETTINLFGAAFLPVQHKAIQIAAEFKSFWSPTASSFSRSPGYCYFLSCGVILSGQGLCKSYLHLHHLIWMDFPWYLRQGEEKKEKGEPVGETYNLSNVLYICSCMLH